MSCAQEGKPRPFDCHNLLTARLSIFDLAISPILPCRLPNQILDCELRSPKIDPGPEKHVTRIPTTYTVSALQLPSQSATLQLFKVANQPPVPAKFVQPRPGQLAKATPLEFVWTMQCLDSVQLSTGMFVNASRHHFVHRFRDTVAEDPRRAIWH